MTSLNTWSRSLLDQPIRTDDLRRMQANRFVEWTHNGGHYGRYSSMLSAPLRPIHGQR
jgi:hypothetical protein